MFVGQQPAEAADGAAPPTTTTGGAAVQGVGDPAAGSTIDRCLLLYRYHLPHLHHLLHFHILHYLPLQSVYCVCITFTFRAFSRRFYQKQLIVSTFVRSSSTECVMCVVLSVYCLGSECVLLWYCVCTV